LRRGGVGTCALRVPGAQRYRGCGRTMRAVHARWSCVWTRSRATVPASRPPSCTSSHTLTTYVSTTSSAAAAAAPQKRHSHKEVTGGGGRHGQHARLGQCPQTCAEVARAEVRAAALADCVDKRFPASCIRRMAIAATLVRVQPEAPGDAATSHRDSQARVQKCRVTAGVAPRRSRLCTPPRRPRHPTDTWPGRCPYDCCPRDRRRADGGPPRGRARRYDA
jgi:hypothetical protein